MSKKPDKKIVQNNTFLIDSQKSPAVKVNLVPDAKLAMILPHESHFTYPLGDCACSMPINTTVEKKKQKQRGLSSKA